ncbi:hypothetical protein [Roseomonas rosulenta]|uniref:hypothetical protein n=1 Tax=Roseomonas rosulenta TaxID=2748667 RepID=UPI0018DF08B3|nr:hypothetical protein [Roseomonas rosulenta]
MSYAFGPTIETAALAILANPSALVWAAGWLAAGLGLWLRAVMPPDDDVDLAIALAGCAL